MTTEFPYLSEFERFQFPASDQATEEGIVCAGGNLSPGMLLSAYSQGLFPWFSEGDPLLWWSPDPRFILFPDQMHITRTLRRTLRRKTYSFTCDKAFERVITSCKNAYRPGQTGTWITDGMRDAYVELHRLGYAHSVESWAGSTLTGGLYGISLGKAFFGESMFSNAPDASKAALVILNSALSGQAYHFIDCQDYTPHVKAMGARHIPREQFLSLLKAAVARPTAKGTWKLCHTDCADGFSCAEILATNSF